MRKESFYSLPPLPYDYKALEPFISEEQLTIHYQKHHQAYINGANSILEKIDEARKEELEIDTKGIIKSLSFNVGGHLLHSLFWENLAPAGKFEKGPEGEIRKLIESEFGSFERFKKEFSSCAITVEGSGWAALCLDKTTGRPMISQIEKHGNNVYTSLKILMLIDVFEHAYYLDYKNDRVKFIDNCWKIINWEAVEKRMK